MWLQANGSHQADAASDRPLSSSLDSSASLCVFDSVFEPAADNAGCSRLYAASPLGHKATAGRSIPYSGTASKTTAAGAEPLPCAAARENNRALLSAESMQISRT